MAEKKSLLSKLADTKLFHWIAKKILVPYWAWRQPTAKKPGGPPPAVQPTQNVQHMMNLVMPLKDKSPIGRAKAVMAVSQNADEIFAGLDNVGTVHFARFVIVDGNLCMISVYDGDFTNYIRDFIATIGSVFDAIVAQIEDGDRVIPSEQNVEAFIDWVHQRDMYQAADMASDVIQITGHNTDGTPEYDLRSLPRDVILQLNANPNVSLGTGYRGYPGYSVAQIREKTGTGW